MEKMMNKKTEGNTFTKKIGQTVYGNCHAAIFLYGNV